METAPGPGPGHPSDPGTPLRVPGAGKPLRAGCSPQVAADGVQALLESGHEALLAAFQGLLVAHPILQAVEDPRYAGAQRLDGGDGLGESLQVHPGAQHPLRHLGRPGPASPAPSGRGGAGHAGKCSPGRWLLVYFLPSDSRLSIFQHMLFSC